MTETAGHNSKVRAEYIRDAVKRIARLDEEIEALQADKRQVKNEVVKGKLGMKVSDFNVALRLYKLEDEDRDELLDSIRECFQALGIGEQSNFLTAIEQPKKGGRRKKVTPEDLGETVNRPHSDTATDEEFEAAAPAEAADEPGF